MRVRPFLLGGALFLSMVAIGSAKTWDIAVQSATQAGTVTLPAGEYSVKLNNNQALFTASNSGKTYNVPVTIQKAARKYSQTSVETKKTGETNVIQHIDLGGTMDELQFGE
jgi:VCBS repeat-containing protein